MLGVLEYASHGGVSENAIISSVVHVQASTDPEGNQMVLCRVGIVTHRCILVAKMLVDVDQT